MNRRTRKKLVQRLVPAAVFGEPAEVRRLLAAGAPAESANREGTTPLCAARAWGHEDTVRVLLGHGADPDRRADHGSGNCPLYRASRGPYPGTADLLRAAGAVDGEGAAATRR
ncbi:ankyrin repeat domain-containing protein [Streptomyces sp. NPDC007088]|uniref:ankyrin repeat domain-containing protein n=1 Tax=Streptomyces sp. NPDC007088 TaxID=3364773 RepID=UPI0036852893